MSCPCKSILMTASEALSIYSALHSELSSSAPVAGGTPGLWVGRLIGRHGHPGHNLGSGDVVPDLWHDGRSRLPQPVQQRQHRRQLCQSSCRCKLRLAFTDCLD